MQDFYKYQGSGNDFVCMEDRDGSLRLTEKEVRHWCHRRWGIGADGLMILAPHKDLDFTMHYFNADGLPGSMCGNGARCLVQMARDLGWVKGDCRFLAPDGVHEGRFLDDGRVAISMKDVSGVQELTWAELGLEAGVPDLSPELRAPICFLDTGSPHLVLFGSEDRAGFEEEARRIRNGSRFREQGINVNWVYEREGRTYMRTFERGVEGETLSCGTGTVAVALYTGILKQARGEQTVQLESRGGTLEVRFEPRENGFGGIRLAGPVKRVFQGQVEMPSTRK